ncbi:MAG: sodium:solute symporter family protein [Myxococcota bacterium]
MNRLAHVDAAVVALYFCTTLLIGLFTSRGISTVQQYVLGDRKQYSTWTLSVALFATVVGGATTIGQASKIFAEGLVWLVSGFGLSLALGRFVTALWIAPAMRRRFDRELSVGEIMNTLYGKPARVVTGIAAATASLGFVGAQMGAMGMVFHSFFPLSAEAGIAIACGLVVIYACLGGIRSVTTTDIWQFAVLAMALPLLAYQAIAHAGGLHALFQHVPSGHLTVLGRPDWQKHLSVFVLMAIPYLGPAYVQRLLMTRDAAQARDCMLVSTVVQVILSVLIALIALGMVATNSQLNPALTLPHAVDAWLGFGLKGLGIASLFAVTMSTADSYLHVAAVSLVHDVVQPLRRVAMPDDKELIWMRVATLILGFGSMWAAISYKSIVGLLLASLSFWVPIVLPPLFAGIFGYRLGVQAFCLAATAGALTTWGWQQTCLEVTSIAPTLPGLLANALVLWMVYLWRKVRCALHW